MNCPCCGRSQETKTSKNKNLLNWCDYCSDKFVEMQRQNNLVCKICKLEFVNCNCTKNASKYLISKDCINCDNNEKEVCNKCYNLSRWKPEERRNK